MSDQIDDVSGARRYVFACADCDRQTQALERAPDGWRFEELADGSKRLRCDACWRRFMLDRRRARRSLLLVGRRCEACGASGTGSGPCPECGIVQATAEQVEREATDDFALSVAAQRERFRARALLLSRRAIRDGLAAGLTREELANIIDEEQRALLLPRDTVKRREKP